MRIAHVTATFPPYLGGTGDVCFFNARELALRGHEVHVFTASVKDAMAQEILDGIHVHRLRPLLRFGNAPLLPQLLTKLGGFDLIHLHYPFLGGELAALAARLTRTPLVITYHNDVLLTGAKAWLEKFLRWTVGRYALRSAASLLFTSRDYGQASNIMPLLHRQEDRIGTLPNGVDTSRFSPGQAPVALYERCKVNPGDHPALLVAALDRAHYFKGVEVFLKALKMLPPYVKGIIIGDGELRASYETTARALGLAERVYFAGRVLDEDLLDYYRLADVTVLPSLTMGEAFGLVLLESMACGRPVIASNLPGVRTVVSEGHDGFLIQPGDITGLAAKLGFLLEDSKLREEMGNRSRAKTEAKYTWASVTEKLEQIYQSILSY
jgi:glycosyltransferase involved in cell wall biosynthesis